VGKAVQTLIPTLGLKVSIISSLTRSQLAVKGEGCVIVAPQKGNNRTTTLSFDSVINIIDTQ
jgi:hypothetical protein